MLQLDLAADGGIGQRHPLLGIERQAVERHVRHRRQQSHLEICNSQEVLRYESCAGDVHSSELGLQALGQRDEHGCVPGGV